MTPHRFCVVHMPKPFSICRFRKLSIVITLMILFTSWIVSAIMSLKFSYMYKVADPFEAFDFLYDKPWQRVGPYIMGNVLKAPVA